MTVDTAFTQFPVLTTKRLRLRQLRPDDAADVFAISSDEQVMEFFEQQPHHSLQDTQELIQKVQMRYEQRESIRWCITLQGEDRVIGACDFHHFSHEFRRAETGYDLHRDFWRKGIMSEAMKAILTYGFTELDLNRVEAIIDIRNERSKGLLLKLGFTYEGNLRQSYYANGQFKDKHYFGLLKHEWQNG